jgi:hypothetical protein
MFMNSETCEQLNILSKILRLGINLGILIHIQNSKFISSCETSVEMLSSLKAGELFENKFVIVIVD